MFKNFLHFLQVCVLFCAVVTECMAEVSATVSTAGKDPNVTSVRRNASYPTAPDTAIVRKEFAFARPAGRGSIEASVSCSAFVQIKNLYD